MIEDKWDARFLEQARLIATWSKDPSTQVGAVVVEPKTRTILATGYNGLPRNVGDTTARLNDRDFKIAATAHAEVNAIYSAARFGHRLEGAWLYCTWPPCTSCAVAIIQTGIARVISPKVEIPLRWVGSMTMAMSLLDEAGVQISQG